MQMLMCRMKIRLQYICVLLVQVVCMVRLEIERTKRLEAQVTVATPDVNVTASLKNILVQLITKL